MADSILSIKMDIMGHPLNREKSEQGFEPLFVADPRSRLVVIGQAPGVKAQKSGIPWGDASGERLMGWLGISETTFRDPGLVAQLPMDFYYPGRGKSGDLPPRREFAPLWHSRLLALMPNVGLILLVGAYAQRYYLGSKRKPTLTQTVLAWKEYLPEYFPIVHPSPLNFRWMSANPWFEADLIKDLRVSVAAALAPK